MTTSNLAILIFVATVALFVASQFAKRSENNPALQRVVKALSVIVLGLAVFYFYKRFIG